MACGGARGLHEPLALQNLACALLAHGPLGVSGEEEGMDLRDAERRVGCFEGEESMLEVVL